MASKIAVEFPLLVGKVISPSSDTTVDEVDTDLEHDQIKRNYGVIFYKHIDSSSINISRTKRRSQRKWKTFKPTNVRIEAQDYRVITE